LVFSLNIKGSLLQLCSCTAAHHHLPTQRPNISSQILFQNSRLDILERMSRNDAEHHLSSSSATSRHSNGDAPTGFLQSPPQQQTQQSQSTSRPERDPKTSFEEFSIASMLDASLQFISSPLLSVPQQPYGQPRYGPSYPGQYMPRHYNLDANGNRRFPNGPEDRITADQILEGSNQDEGQQFGLANDWYVYVEDCQPLLPRPTSTYYQYILSCSLQWSCE
jgi:hypothetical protein